MKKLIAFLLAAMLLASVAGAFAAKSIGMPGTMFVYTENGKALNVRSTPEKGDNIIGSLKYGSKVKVSEFQGDWAVIDWGDTCAYVQSRYLMWYKPDPKITPKPTEDPGKKEEEQKNEELQSETPIGSVLMQAQATRASGWVNMRLGPSKATRRVETLADGTQVTAFAETTNWYHVTNPATGNSGDIRKDFLKEIPVPVPTPVVDETTRIGTVNVNGDFLLQCKVPEGYTLQTLPARGSQIIASLDPDDVSRPKMVLNITFNEMYADVERMNDLSDEEMDTLKATFTDMNEVEFSEAYTGAGTKLLIARETGSDEDFVSIFSVYKGYCVEFLLAPNPDAAQQTLTDTQVQTAIDFLTNLDFLPAN